MKIESGTCYVWLIAIMYMVAFIIMATIIVYVNYKHRKQLREIALYQIHVTSQIDSSIPEILDLIIRESFTDYRVKYLEPLGEGHINSERESQIRKDLIEVVTSRISDAALDKLSLFYNIQNIADILADKIYILVMNYVVEHNEDIQQ